MRTTLVLDDSLLRAARHRAAAHDTTLSEVINEALRQLISAPQSPARAVKLPTFGNRKHRQKITPQDIARALDADAV